MQIKISKTLEAIIARAAFNTTKAGLDHSLKDFLTLELLREEGSLAYQLLSSRLKDWELYQIRLRIEREMLAGQQSTTQSPEEFYRAFTEELRACSGAARSVSTAHALRAIVGDRTTATSRILEMYGVTGTVVDEDLKKFAVGDDFRTEIQVHMLDFNEENKPEEKTSSHLLDKFGVNLTRMAREGKIDPVVGREQEIERVVQILSRRKKNNPILIGEAGVGKSAIVEGLALRIASGEVPYTIADRRSSRSTSRRWWPARNSAANSRSACSSCSTNCARRRIRSSSSTRSTPSWAQVRRRAVSTRPTSSSRRWRAASCRPSAPPRSTSTARTSRAIRPSNAASRRSWWSLPRPTRRSRSCATSRPTTNAITRCVIRKRPCRRA